MIFFNIKDKSTGINRLTFSFDVKYKIASKLGKAKWSLQKLLLAFAKKKMK